MTEHTPPPTDTPADAADRTDATADGSESLSEAPIIVLQVEPDTRSAELLEAFASRRADRVRVRSVETAAAALDVLETGVEVGGERVGVDCVVTEQLLPDGDGVELAERLREAGCGLPIVFHTTCPEEEREVAAFGAGADAYFEKGADRGRYDTILDRICALVDVRRDSDDALAATPRTPDSALASLRSEE